MLKMLDKGEEEQLEWSENLDGFHNSTSKDEHGVDDPLIIIRNMMDVPLLLILVGVITALVTYIMKIIVTCGDAIRLEIVGNEFIAWRFLLYVSFCVLMSSVSCFVTQTICPEAVGGGLPEMKVILSGTIKPVLLSPNMLIAKFVGLTFALLGGLTVGREGPDVHMSCVIADQLMSLPFFNHIKRQDTKRLEVLGCACASGVSATFGTAFGGILFSIEFTSTAYLVKSLPKAFLCALSAMLVYFLLGALDDASLIGTTGSHDEVAPTAKHVSSLTEVGFFVAFGVVCGLFGVIFVWMVESRVCLAGHSDMLSGLVNDEYGNTIPSFLRQIIFTTRALTAWKQSLLDPRINSRFTVAGRRYALVGIVTAIVSALMYFEMIVVNQRNGSSVVDVLSGIFDTSNRELTLLMVTFPVKIIVLAFSVTLPLPVGLFSPTFWIGGLLGRIIGEVLDRTLVVSNFTPWEFAIIGAAAFTTGVTRALSTAVIVFELVGRPHLCLPVSVAILGANFVGNRLTKNVYDVLTELRGDPFLQDMPSSLQFVQVSEAMIPISEQHVLTLHSTYLDAEKVLYCTGSKHMRRRSRRSMSLNAHSARHAAPEHSGYHSDSESLDGPRTPVMANPNRGKNKKRATTSDDPRGGAGSPSDELRLNESVIPVVQNKRTMVIVGAVQRADVQQAVLAMRNLADVASMQPVALGVRHKSDSESSDDNDGGRQSAKPPAPQKRLITTLFSGDDDYSTDDVSDNSSDRLGRSRHKQYMNQIITYTVITDGGRSAAPVVSASSGKLREDGSLAPLSPVPWGTNAAAITIDPSPYQVVDTMQLKKVDMVFRMLTLNQAHVTRSGRLVGLITRTQLRKFFFEKGQARQPSHRIVQLCAALVSCIKRLFTPEQRMHPYDAIQDDDAESQSDESDMGALHTLERSKIGA